MDAFASPIKYNGEIVEYQSVRFKPERIYVKRAEKAYAKLQNDKNRFNFTYLEHVFG